MPLAPHRLLLDLNTEWFAFVVPAYPGCAEKEAIKQVLLLLLLIANNSLHLLYMVLQN